jgi:hypothetical protein
MTNGECVAGVTANAAIPSSLVDSQNFTLLFLNHSASSGAELLVCRIFTALIPRLEENRGVILEDGEQGSQGGPGAAPAIGW